MRVTRLCPLFAVVLAMAVCLGIAAPEARADGSATIIENHVRQSFERSDVPGMVAVVVHGDQIVWAGGARQQHRRCAHERELCCAGGIVDEILYRDRGARTG